MRLGFDRNPAQRGELADRRSPAEPHDDATIAGQKIAIVDQQRRFHGIYGRRYGNLESSIYCNEYIDMAKKFCRCGVLTAADAQHLGSAGRPVWRAAGEMVALHGRFAPLYAMQSVDLSLERGDLKGAMQWRLVWRIVELLLSEEGATAHRRVH
jgi:hypothetical protein